MLSRVGAPRRLGRLAAVRVLVVTNITPDPAAPAHELVAAAFSWRSEPPADPAAATTLLRGGLVPLYRHYLDDHTARLTDLKELDLAAAFERWRHRLEDGEP